jgi:hypothetical protein
MTPMVKYVIATVAAAWISDKVVGQFTDGGDSATEKLMWRLGSAALVGAIVSKVGK